MGHGSMVYICSSGKKDDILKMQKYLYEKWYIARLITTHDEGIGQIDAAIFNSDITYEYVIDYNAKPFDSKENIKEVSVAAGTPCLLIFAYWHGHNTISKYLEDFESANNVIITSFDYSLKYDDKYTFLDGSVDYRNYYNNKLIQAYKETGKSPELNNEFDTVKKLLLKLKAKYNVPIFAQMSCDDSELSDFVNMMTDEKIMYGSVDSRYIEDNKIKHINFYGTHLEVDLFPGSSNNYKSQFEYMMSDEAPIRYSYDYKTSTWKCDTKDTNEDDYT